MTLEQLRPYYQGVYFATVSIKKMFADEGLEGGNLAKRLDGYQELVTEYNEAIKETFVREGRLKAGKGRQVRAR
jgi:hypothetical protein